MGYFFFHLVAILSMRRLFVQPVEPLCSFLLSLVPGMTCVLS
uniref:Uncharacterized protein n=1 Tax=Arundo donax TaxID=35708 RepID=A0A0A9F4R2_ARUDO